MSPDRFDHLLSLVHDGLVKRFHIDKPISPEERLAVTLRYLATGDSQTSIGFLFKLGRSSVSGIIEEVCDELWRALSPEYSMRPPQKVIGKRLPVTFMNFGICHIALVHLMANTYVCANPLIRDHYGIIIKGASVWYF